MERDEAALGIGRPKTGDTTPGLRGIATAKARQLPRQRRDGMEAHRPRRVGQRRTL